MPAAGLAEVLIAFFDEPDEGFAAGAGLCFGNAGETGLDFPVFDLTAVVTGFESLVGETVLFTLTGFLEITDLVETTLEEEVLAFAGEIVLAFVFLTTTGTFAATLLDVLGFLADEGLDFLEGTFTAGF
ncbi:MAG: hypothetical protein ACKORE_07200 [Bacteroidota bacterium]